MAFASACTVATQCPSSIRQPTSSQCGSPRIEPLYPVERIVRSRTITAPTCLRGQVEREATCWAMFMKYVCQSTRSLIRADYASRIAGRIALDMHKQRRVVVTGIGAVTSIGSGIAEFWKNLLAGVCGIRPFDLFDPSGYRTQTAGAVTAIPDGFLSASEKRRMSRADRMGLAAAREALEASGLDLSQEDTRRIGVILGGGTSGLLDSEAFFENHLHGRKDRPSRVLNHLPDAITDRIAQRFSLEGLKSTITTACSSSANAMGYAHDAIASGLADVVLTGGSDVLARLTYGGFNSLRSVDPEPCRPFDRDRKGLSIGEAAGILVFEERERARRRGAPILAEFLGYGVTSDAYHMTAPDPSGAAGGRTVRISTTSTRTAPRRRRTTPPRRLRSKRGWETAPAGSPSPRSNP